MIPWGDINTVFLDMDGTLLDLNFDNHFWLEHVPQRYAEARGLEPAAAKVELLAATAAARGRWSGTASITGAASSGSTSPCSRRRSIT